MANSFAASADTVFESFYPRMGSYVRSWEPICPILTDMREASSRRFYDLTGIGTFSSMGNETATPSLSSLLQLGASYSDAAFEKSVAVTEFQWMKNPMIFQDIARAMADAAWQTISNTVWDLAATPDTITHPKNGGSGFTADGSPAYLADVFTAPVSQTNLANSALSAAALTTAKAIMRDYKNHSGLNIDCASGPLYLVVPSELEAYARDLAGRDKELVVSTAVEESTAWGIQGVIVNPNMLDTNDWSLINADLTPYRFWLTQPPTINVARATDANRYIVTAWYAGGYVLLPFEGGLYHSNGGS